MIIGVFTFSVFMIMNAFYNAGMGFARYIVLNALNQKRSDKKEFEVFRTAGWVLLFSSVLYVLYTVCGLSAGQKEKFPPIIAIGIVAVVCTEIVVNAVGLISTRRTRHLALHANKCISLASSLINLVLVQTALMSLPEWHLAFVFNGISGIFFGTCAALLGVYMLLFEKLEIKKYIKK